jgi:hypothetical protein
MCGLDQMTCGHGRRLAPAQQDLAVLTVQRVARRPRDHVTDNSAQERVPEREHVLGGGHDPCAHRLLDRRQQRGRRFAEHLGRVFQPERGTQNGCGHQHVPGPFAEAVEPLLPDTMHPPGKLRGNQHGTAVGELHGVVVAQPMDQLGEQRGIPGGTTSEG